MVFDRMNDESSLFKGARRLCHEAYKRGSTDNISVVVVDLRSSEWARFSRRGGEDEGDEGVGGHGVHREYVGPRSTGSSE